MIYIVTTSIVIILLIALIIRERLSSNYYQKQTGKTAIYKNEIQKFICIHFGLAGEVGEFLEKVKKIYRDDSGIINPQKRQEIKKELGDIEWYLSEIQKHYGFKKSEIQNGNLRKLKKRKKENKIKGSGDNR